MKKILTLFFLLGFTIFPQNLYFSEPTSTHIDYIYQNGQGPIAYHMYVANGWVVHWWKARLTSPNPTNWMLGQSGGWWVSQAGTYTIQGQVYATYFPTGTSHYLDREVTWSVVDNYPPSAPQNLTVTKSVNNHPQLSWSPNSELDILNYRIYKKITSELGFQYLNSTTNSSYEDPTETYPYPGGPGITHPISYYVKAADINSHLSDASNTVTTNVSGASPEKIGVTGVSIIEEYSLEQNYPNPFNPMTNITYQIQENGFVSLKVYDLVGKEVASLVSEVQSPGHYNVSFNGTNLPSGIYICSLRVNEFVQNMKMTLLK